MSLVSFLNNLFKDDGFELIDSNSKKYVIGSPNKKKPIVIKLLDKRLMQKLLINPDLYFGEAYMDGSLVIENGTLTEFLDLAFKNIGRGNINSYGAVIKKIRGTFGYITNLNKIVMSKDSCKNFISSNKLSNANGFWIQNNNFFLILSNFHFHFF